MLCTSAQIASGNSSDFLRSRCFCSVPPRRLHQTTEKISVHFSALLLRTTAQIASPCSHFAIKKGGFCSAPPRRLHLEILGERVSIDELLLRTSAQIASAKQHKSQSERAAKLTKQPFACAVTYQILEKTLPFRSLRDIRYARSAVRTSWAIHENLLFAPAMVGTDLPPFSLECCHCQRGSAFGVVFEWGYALPEAFAVQRILAL